MTWIKVESSVARNRKFLDAGPAASWLWLCGLAYAQEGLTDGFIPFQALRMLGVKNAEPLKRKLVDVKLWDAVDGGWQIHDYLHYNRSAEEVRRIQGERRDGGRLGGRPLKPSTETLKGNHNGNPSTETPTATKTETPTDQTVRAPLARGAPIHQTHRSHAACGRICVPASLHANFVRLRNHDDADKELRDWYLSVDNEWSVGARKSENTGGDEFKFWRARFEERWPAATVRAAAVVVAERWECRHVERCANREMCASATILGRPESA